MNWWKRFEFVVSDARERLLQTWVVVDPETKAGHTPRSLEDRWITACLSFLFYAELISGIDGEPITLSSHRMVRNGILRLPAWKIYKSVLVEAGFLEVVPFVGTDYAIRHYAIGELHSSDNPGWGGVTVRWNRHTIRHALQHGYFELTPLPNPDSEPPEMTIGRGTRTQWEQYAHAKQQEQLQRATIGKRVSVPVLPQNTTVTQPAQVATSPEWLIRKCDILLTQLAAHRYNVRVESAKLYPGAQVFLLYFRKATEQQVELLKSLMAQCLHVTDVRLRFALGAEHSGSLYAWVEAPMECV